MVGFCVSRRCLWSNYSEQLEPCDAMAVTVPRSVTALHIKFVLVGIETTNYFSGEIGTLEKAHTIVNRLVFSAEHVDHS